jgi:hypothetical protein
MDVLFKEGHQKFLKLRERFKIAPLSVWEIKISKSYFYGII